ncbi:MAG: FtsX-like permease family protein [Geminicoccaceae bacterium]
MDGAAAWRIARRDLRGGMRGLIVFLVSLALGVAAIVAVGSLNEGVRRAVERDATALLGGDIAVEVANLPLPQDEVDALLTNAERRSFTTRTSTLVGTGEGRHVAVSLKAVDGAYPLFGAVLLDPPLPLADALAGNGAVAEAGLFSRLRLKVGDRVQLGAIEVELRAVMVSEPDRLGGFMTLGPRMLVSEATLDAAQILQPGALAEFTWRADLPAGLSPGAEVARLRDTFPDARWRARSVEEVQPQVARFTDRLATYLTLAGLTALLTGGVGIGLAIDGYLRARHGAIATMKCLGATSGQVFQVYLLQVAILALTGIGIGVALGQLLPLATWLIPAGVLPVLPQYGFYLWPILLAAAAGLLTALVFAVWPLAMARRIPPARLFRSIVAPSERLPETRFLVVIGVAVVALVTLAIASSPRPELAGWFVGVAGASALVLALTAKLLLRGIARLARRLPGRLRLPLANVYRPGSGAVSVMIAIGAGLAVLTTVGLLQANLAREIEAGVSTRAPSLVFIDIQPPQLEAFRNTVAQTPGAEILQEAPVLRARVVRISGVPVDQANVGERAQWTLRRDRGLSFRADMPPGTELVAGEWWPADYSGPPLVSVEDDVALGYGVGVGDTLAFNILGRTVEARIANLRKEIDWSSGRMDFVFLLSPGVIEKAPHTLVATVEAPPGTAPQMVDAMAEALPNVTPIEVGEVARQIEDVLGKISLAIRSVAAVTLVSGALVLAGAVGAARRRHRYQSVILKVLGATRGDVVRAFLVEYLVLCLAAAAVGVVIGIAAAAGIVTWGFKGSFVLAPGAVLVTVALALVLALAAGVASLWRTLGQSAAAALRMG